ncbi:MAG TPA: hypothetical protein VFH17_04955, partial [Coriobacteriia bacterium]|nr:hypothetical protein [Coriobacteriia bacterium]
MTLSPESESVVSLDGQALLEEGRRSRARRAWERTFRGRFDALFSGRPAWVRWAAAGTTITLVIA